MLNLIALVELFLCWIAWSLAFANARKRASGHAKAVRAIGSWWGILLVGLSFGLVWTYFRPNQFEKPAVSLIASMLLGPPSVALAWASTRHLGKQWRYEAALSEDHELVQTGPYRWLRHPIYASMLGMILTTGFCWTWWPMFVAAIVVFIAGTEIRIRAEDRLLAARFQERFASYRSRVPAYIPFLR